MPYFSNKDLPSGVRSHLPDHAQDIYREAFNHAWLEYGDPYKRWPGSSQEDAARRTAWATVKKKYHKVGTEWVENAKGA